MTRAAGRPRHPTPAPVRVVVGVDEDEASWAALRFGVAEAARRGGDVLAVHCWQRARSWETPATGDRDTPGQPVGVARGLTALVDAVVAERVADGQEPVVVTAHAVEGDAATELWRLAEDATLLVVGARHHDVVLGSVSHFLSGNPPCPLVVVPAPS